MTCDEFLPALETGSPSAQAAARRHAATCNACVATQAAWERLRAELAAAPPLTAEQQGVWRAAAQGAAHAASRAATPNGLSPFQGESASSTSGGGARSRLRRPLLFGMAASGIAAAALAAVLLRPPGRPAAVSLAPARRFSPERFAQELAALAGGLDQLERELDALAERVARIEPRRAAAALLAEYRP